MEAQEGGRGEAGVGEDGADVCGGWGGGRGGFGGVWLMGWDGLARLMEDGWVSGYRAWRKWKGGRGVCVSLSWPRKRLSNEAAPLRELIASWWRLESPHRPRGCERERAFREVHLVLARRENVVYVCTA